MCFCEKCFTHSSLPAIPDGDAGVELGDADPGELLGDCTPGIAATLVGLLLEELAGSSSLEVEGETVLPTAAAGATGVAAEDEGVAVAEPIAKGIADSFVVCAGKLAV